MAARNFNAKQALEHEIKDLWAEIQPSVIGVAATTFLNTSLNIDLTSVAVGAARNTTTFQLAVNAPAANPSATVLAAFTGTAAAIVCTITPNDGTNNPVASATIALNLSTDVVLTKVIPGEAHNGDTFELVVDAPAANTGAQVLVAFTGTAAAIVCTVTPNDGTNNGLTPVSLDEDELTELINTGVVVGKTITLTDAGSLRNDQTATGGAASDALTAGDNQVVAFADGTNPEVLLTEEELTELINTGAVVGKTITLTDAGSLRNDQTAVGGDTSVVDMFYDQTVTFTGGVTAVAASLVSGVGFASVSRTDTGEYTLTLQDAYTAVRSVDAIWKRDTAEDIQFQVTSEAVATSEAPTIVITALAGATPTDPSDEGTIMVKVELKNSSVRD